MGKLFTFIKNSPKNQNKGNPADAHYQKNFWCNIFKRMHEFDDLEAE